MEKLIWKIDKENSNGGYWECSNCHVQYSFPKYWKPKVNYCMKCKTKWEIEK